jgi:predicted lipase
VHILKSEKLNALEFPNVQTCRRSLQPRGRMTRAFSAADAGAYLSEKAGLKASISAQQMWHYARTGVIPVFRIGRRVWFREVELDAFVAVGGAAFPPQTPGGKP